MIKIDPVNENILSSSFHDPNVLKRFQEKYAKVYSRISLAESSRGNLYLEKNLLTSSSMSGAVIDHGSLLSMRLTITQSDQAGNKKSAHVNLQQLPGLCGVVVINTMERFAFEGKEFECIQDICFLLGYAVALLSWRANWLDNKVYSSEVTYKKVFNDSGFVPYMEMKNRRTSADVVLYYKQLNNPFK